MLISILKLKQFLRKLCNINILIVYIVFGELAIFASLNEIIDFMEKIMQHFYFALCIHLLFEFIYMFIPTLALTLNVDIYLDIWIYGVKLFHN